MYNSCTINIFHYIILPLPATQSYLCCAFLRVTVGHTYHVRYRPAYASVLYADWLPFSDVIKAGVSLSTAWSTSSQQLQNINIQN